ncbi:MAG: TadE family protein [Silvibacterium sp.]
MLTHRLRKDAGGALIELAFVLPVFLLLVIGAAEFGRLAYISIEVSNAARAAVAYGAQNHETAIDNTGMTNAAKYDALNITDLTVNPGYSCYCYNGTTTSSVACSSAAASCVSGNDQIMVNVQVSTAAAVNTLFNYPGIPTTFTLRGFASMAVEQ